MVQVTGVGLVRARTSTGRPRPSIVALARVVVEAFSKFEQRNVVGVLQLWVGTLAALWLYEQRVHTSGRALCLLGVRRSRAFLAAAALVVVVGVLGTVSALAVASLVAVVFLAFLPLAWNGVREVPARLSLAAVTPTGRYLYVHCFASTLRGAGAELLWQVCSEADGAGVPLALDAAGPRLVEYYGAFGFRACGGPVRLPDGHLLQRMWRPVGQPVYVSGLKAMGNGGHGPSGGTPSGGTT